MEDQGSTISINIDQLELDLSNPRHKPFKRPAQAIEYLVLKEDVVGLAVDIAKVGTNPMDLLGVFKKGTGDTATYVAVEGNRRVCALMLLHDPEKIPSGIDGRAKMIKRLETAAKPAHISPELNVVLFKSKKSAKPWVERMHIRDGNKGRRRWTPDQQNRAIGGGRNQDAAALLDLALAQGMIKEADRASKLTTVQRYLGNPTMRKTLGIVRDRNKEYWVNREIGDFSLLLDFFLEDVRQGNLSSRSNAAEVIRYSDQLLERSGVGDDRVKPLGIGAVFDEVAQLRTPKGSEDDDADGDQDGDGDDDDDGNQKSDKGGGIRPRQTIGSSPELESAFAEYGNHKLQSLYVSVTTLSLKRHCPIVTVGFWSLMESLAALHGGEGSTFAKYFNPQRLQKDFGFSGREKMKDIKASLEHLTSKGNSTKHSAIAASFDGNQVANDFDVLTPLMLVVLRNLPTDVEP